METLTKDRLYKLLPYIYQLRDAEQGEPLRELLQIIEEQVNIVEADIAQIYANWFIETCEDWVVPYLGDLIGYTEIHEGGALADIDTHHGKLKRALVTPRRDVANTIYYRRRKGSLALLEELADDIASWPARAVEFFPLLGWTQHMAHLHPTRGRYVDLRRTRSLQKLNGPFDKHAHTVDIRSINSPTAYNFKPPQGRYNVANVGLFVWRLRAYSVTRTPVLPLEQRNCYTFSVLGNNTQLFSKWETQNNRAQIAGRANVPEPISRHEFTWTKSDNTKQASEDYYGENKSLAIWVSGWPEKRSPLQLIPASKIIPADLSNWDHYVPKKNTVAVDPVLGRILFAPLQIPYKQVLVSYHYGMSADIGGGEYYRNLVQPMGAEPYYVGVNKTFKTINQALTKWQEDFNNKPFNNGIIEITDSHVYEEAIEISLPENHHLQLRAANGTRPVILLANRPNQFTVSGNAKSYLRLSGLLIAGRGLQIENNEPEPSDTESINIENHYTENSENYSKKENNIAGVIIQHTTFVPGWSLKPDCEPDQLEEPSIEITNVQPCLTIEHSILGSIQINNNAVDTDPMQVRINHSVLDATGSDCEGPACEAIGAFGSAIAHANLTTACSTVFGRVDVHAIALAENTIFMGSVKVARRQHGCMRFCYVKPGSRTPRRYHCQPDFAQQRALESAAEAIAPLKLSEQTISDITKAERERVRPQFTSQRYGKPGYCQLAESCALDIKQGAEDESEIGVFHDLYQPQRLNNLRTRLDEYIPARCDAGIILVN